MKDMRIMASFFTFEGWAGMEPALYLLSAAVVLYAMYFVVKMLYIRRCRYRMDDYSSFVRKTYAKKRIPPLIERYRLKEIEKYNRLRAPWPFRCFWESVDASVEATRGGSAETGDNGTCAENPITLPGRVDIGSPGKEVLK